MKDLIINYYCDKKLVSAICSCKSVKIEIRAKLIVVIDNDNVVFACKLADFVSLQF